MLDEQTGRDITVKGRQTRASSLILARNVRRMTTGFSLKCLVMTHSDQTTAIFRDRIKHHLNDLKQAGLDYPIVLDNKDEIVIGKDLGNRFVFASGEERAAGRSYSAHIAHISELAHWPPERAGELIGGITPAVPGPPHGWFDMESTPNGAEGVFYEYAQDALTTGPLQSWRLHFYPWWLEPRYRAGTEPDCDLLLAPAELASLCASFEPAHHETLLMDQHGLSVEQVLWRRWREHELAKTGVPFRQEFPEDVSSCFITGSENYFSSPDGTDHLSVYREGCTDPAQRLDALPFRQHRASFYGPHLAVWEYPDPKFHYVVFMDLAEGGAGRDHDYSALVVMNSFTRHHAATLRLKCAPGDFALMACAVGQYYNWAVLGGERGGYGSAALEKIQRELNYPHIYYHRDYGKQYAKVEPWIYPTQQHRDEMLQTFREAVFEHSFHTRDRALVSEMGTFNYHKLSLGRPGFKARAKKKRNDDLVISAAGAIVICGRTVRRRPLAEEPAEVVVGPHGLVLSRTGDGSTPSTRRHWFV